MLQQLKNMLIVQNVMKIGIEVLERNCPGEGRVGMPQMIKSLCDLMEELGKLR